MTSFSSLVNCKNGQTLLSYVQYMYVCIIYTCTALQRLHHCVIHDFTAKHAFHTTILLQHCVIQELTAQCRSIPGTRRSAINNLYYNLLHFAINRVKWTYIIDDAVDCIYARLSRCVDHLPRQQHSRRSRGVFCQHSV